MSIRPSLLLLALTYAALPCATIGCQSSTTSTAKQLQSLRQLHDSGVLSDAEYEQKVATLRGKSASASTPQRSASPAAPARAAATGTSGTAWKLHLVNRAADFPDAQTGQSVHMEVYSILLPDGWQDTTPGPPAGRDCAYNQSRLVLLAASKDHSTGVLILPAPATFWSTNSMARQQRASFSRQFTAFTCTIEQPQPMESVLSQVGKGAIQNSQVQGSLQPVPGLSDQLAGMVQSANAQGSQVSAQAGRVRLSGSIQGKQVDAWVIGLMTQKPDSGGVITDYPLLAVVFAPVGQLEANEKLLMTVLSSYQVAPQWANFVKSKIASELQMIQGAQQTVARIHQQMAQDDARAAQQQAAIMAGASAYRSQVMNNVASDRAAALDHSSQQFALYMGDQGLYHDPSSGKTVQLPSNYGHVWASGNSSDYLLTDSPSYNPNGQAGSGSWTQLQPVQ